MTHQSLKGPRISIITPSYNQGQYLEATIQSVLSQAYLNYELIIIDGESTDSTLEVIRRYEQHITYWVSEPDRGQSHAIQKGLAVATGDIINWINSDDLIAPGAFERIAAEFALDTYDVFCGYCDYFTVDLQHLDARGMRMALGATVGDTLLVRTINQPSTYFKASVLKELGVDEQFHYTMDLDLWYRYLLRAGQQRVLLSEGLLSYFRLHEASKSVADSQKFEGDMYKVYHNVLYSLNMPEPLLAFSKLPIADSQFQPTRYAVGIEKQQLASFIRWYAWDATIYYNQNNQYVAAQQCLAVARRYGQPFSISVMRQYIKLYLVPHRLLRQLNKQ